MKRMTGFSRCAGIDRKDFEEMSNAGIDCIEVSPRYEEYDTILDLKRLKSLADEYGIMLWSFHQRFSPDYDISTTDEEARRRVLEYYKKHIVLCAEVGIKNHIVHASSEPIEDTDRPARIDAAKRSLCELAEFAASYDALIAVEDLPRSCLANCSRELLDIISVDDRLRIVFDTNHLLGEPIADFIRACAHKFLTTHFSDYDFINERHWLPGEGDIDWRELMDTLDECGYTGPVLYELTLAVDLWSIDRERAITAFDVKRNHIELEGRLKPTPLGVRKPKLGMWKCED